MILQWHLHLAMPRITTFCINHHDVSKKDINFRLCFEKSRNCPQSAWKILLIAIQVSQDLAARTPKSPVHRIIHSLVLFDEHLHPTVLLHPIQRAVIRSCILHDVLRFHRLVRH